MSRINPRIAANFWVWIVALISTSVSVDAGISQEIWKYHCSTSSDNFVFDIVMDINTRTIFDNGQAFINGDNLNECVVHVTWAAQDASWGQSCDDGTVVVDSLEYPSGIYRHHARGPADLSDSIAYCRGESSSAITSTLGWLRKIFVH
jgi:hypothetical protein